MADDKALSALDADSIIWSAVECADKVAEGEVDPEVGMPSASSEQVPGYEL